MAGSCLTATPPPPFSTSDTWLMVDCRWWHAAAWLYPPSPFSTSDTWLMLDDGMQLIDCPPPLLNFWYLVDVWRWQATAWLSSGPNLRRRHHQTASLTSGRAQGQNLRQQLHQWRQRVQGLQGGRQQNVIFINGSAKPHQLCVVSKGKTLLKFEIWNFL